MFLYLLARCIKGAVRYNNEGMFNQSPDKRRLGTRPETMRQNIMAVSLLLRGKTVVTARLNASSKLRRFVFVSISMVFLVPPLPTKSSQAHNSVLSCPIKLLLLA